MKTYMKSPEKQQNPEKLVPYNQSMEDETLKIKKYLSHLTL